MNLKNNAKLKRNLLFCLITSLETDLRNNIIFLLNENLEIESSIIAKLKERYLTSFSDNLIDLNILVDYLDFGDYSQILNHNLNIFSNKKKLKSLSKELEEIVPIRNRVMHNRPLEFDDDEVVLKFIKKIDYYTEIINFEETKKEYVSIENDSNHLIKINLDKLKVNNDKIKHNLPMVDYDDTGFIGRIKDKEILKNKLYSSYPVITLVGIGGIGKTSLVLSCLYDLIEESEKSENNNFFDTIIWTTLKTNGLFDGEFKAIKDSITDLTLGLKKAETDIENIDISNVDEILKYMKNNRTLLVIDNFETITNGDTDKLFDELPNGSKILVTSRKSIGNYERSIKLLELDTKDAIMYFRRLANIYKVNSLIKLSDEKIFKFLEKLKNSPLAIKWFVINVGKGTSPEKILSQKYEELTTFCLSNIYEKLSADAKHILRVILWKKNKCEQAEIVYISELDYLSCATAIEELFGSNFLQQNDDYTYSIPEFTVNYIQGQRDDSTIQKDNKIQINISKLNGSLENLTKDIHLKNHYHPLSLFPKTNSEKIATLYMLKAIESSKKRDLNKIDEYFALAKDSAPQFSDIYKIAGYLYSKFNIISAEKNYQTALLFSDNRAPIHYFYAGFLINNQNYERAELEMSYAKELDSSNELIKLRLARLYKMQNKYDKSLFIRLLTK